MNNNSNQPAFPLQVGEATINKQGLTKREIFALGAMIGMLAKSNDTPDFVAPRAIRHADEILKHLEENKIS